MLYEVITMVLRLERRVLPLAREDIFCNRKFAFVFLQVTFGERLDSNLWSNLKIRL